VTPSVSCRAGADATRVVQRYDVFMSEPISTGAAASDPATPGPGLGEASLPDVATGSSRSDPRAGGRAEDAPSSLLAVELVPDDESIASNDEWDDPERL